MSLIATFFLRIQVFSAKPMLKTRYIVNKNLYFVKEKFIDLVLLLDYLQNYTVGSFPNYRVTELLVVTYLLATSYLTVEY